MYYWTIHDDPDLAEDFIVKLTKVYRYVLDLKDQDTVELADELNLLKATSFSTEFALAIDSNSMFRSQGIGI